MGKKKTPKVSMPPDPDPTPMTASDPSPEVQGAARAEKKRSVRQYGRHQTVIAGNTDADGKKTVLGG